MYALGRAPLTTQRDMRGGKGRKPRTVEKWEKKDLEGSLMGPCLEQIDASARYVVV